MSKEDIQTIIKEIKKILKYTAKSFLYIYSGIFLIYTIFINIFSNMLTNNNFFSNCINTYQFIGTKEALPKEYINESLCGRYISIYEHIAVTGKNIIFISIIISLIMGIVIYLNKDKDKNYLKKISLSFIIAILIAGFIQPILISESFIFNFDIEEFTLVPVLEKELYEYWMFPTYLIIPIILIFIIKLCIDLKKEHHKDKQTKSTKK